MAGDPVHDLAALLARVGRLERQVAAGSGFSHGHVSIEDAAVVEKDSEGNVTTIIGKQWDGTHGAVTVGGPTPPAPTGLTVEPTPGGLTVGWSGEFVEDGVAPMDFARVEVHASTVAGYLPDRSTVLVTFETPQGGRAFLPLPAGATQYVRLLTRATSGKGSPPTPAVAAEPLPAADVDIEEIVDEVISRIPAPDGTIIYATVEPNEDGTGEGDTWYRVDAGGNLVLGAWRWDGDDWVEQKFGHQVVDSVTAGQITTGLLAAGVKITAGDPAGSRVEIDAEGIRKYGPTNTIDVDLASDQAVFSGTVVGSEIIGSTIRTALSGNRVEVIPADDFWGVGSTLRFHVTDDPPARPAEIAARLLEVSPGDYDDGDTASLMITAPAMGDLTALSEPRLILVSAAAGYPTVPGTEGGSATVQAPEGEASVTAGRVVRVEAPHHRITADAVSLYPRYVESGPRRVPELYYRFAGGTDPDTELAAHNAELARMVVVVQNAAHRDSLTSHGYTATPSRPLIVWRLDAPLANKLEVSTDGTAWTSLGTPPMASGITAVPAPTPANGADYVQVTITFPSGRFTAAPMLLINPSSARTNTQIVSITAASAAVRVYNWTTVAAGPHNLNWYAVQEV